MNLLKNKGIAASKASLRKSYGETLVALGEKYEDMVVLDADLAVSTKTIEFKKKFPERFFNIGVAEGDMVGTAAGFASAGKITVASTFAIFLTGRAWEQIRQAVAYPKLNVKLVATHGGITVGPDGASHHCNEDLALMRVLPHMTIIVPADANETKKAVTAAIAYEGPVYIRLSRLDFPVLPADYPFNIGRAQILRAGKKATIIACGLMVHKALEAADILGDVGVINMSTIKPVDTQAIIAAAKETGAVVTAEEHSIIGGLGSAVAEVLGEHCPTPLKRVGISDLFGESGDPESLLKKFGLTADGIVAAVKTVSKRKNLLEKP